jgi:hypothetical protein
MILSVDLQCLCRDPQSALDQAAPPSSCLGLDSLVVFAASQVAHVNPANLEAGSDTTKVAK